VGVTFSTFNTTQNSFRIYAKAISYLRGKVY